MRRHRVSLPDEEADLPVRRVAKPEDHVLRAVGQRKTAPGWHEYQHHRITPKADAAREAGMEMIY